MLARILSALVALPIAVFVVELGGIPYLILAAVVTLIALLEFGMMTQPNDRIGVSVLVGAGLLLFAAIALGVLVTTRGMIGGFFGLMLVLLVHLFRTGDIEDVAARMGLSALGVVWVGGMMGCLAALRSLPGDTAWIYIAFIVSFGSDTGAYFAGRFFGKHKLYEKVSPKKTWEGAVGGVVVAVAGSFGLVYGLGRPLVEPLHLGIVTGVGAALGQMGDLAESLLKRSVGVKDSGKIMPGHGGALDRVDALMFVGTWMLAYAVLVMNLEPIWVSL